MSYLDKKIEDYTSKKSSVKLPKPRAWGFGSYQFPYIDDVPADLYFSEIVCVEECETTKGKKGITVFYTMVNFFVAYRAINKIALPTDGDKHYYIKQTYTYDSTYYTDFIEAMCEAMNFQVEEDEEYLDFGFEELIGIREAIKLSYKDSNGIGSITERSPWNRQDFVDKYQRQLAAEEEYRVATSAVEADEYY